MTTPPDKTIKSIAQPRQGTTRPSLKPFRDGKAECPLFRRDLRVLRDGQHHPSGLANLTSLGLETSGLLAPGGAAIGGEVVDFGVNLAVVPVTIVRVGRRAGAGKNAAAAQEELHHAYFEGNVPPHVREIYKEACSEGTARVLARLAERIEVQFEFDPKMALNSGQTVGGKLIVPMINSAGPKSLANSPLVVVLDEMGHAFVVRREKLLADWGKPLLTKTRNPVPLDRGAYALTPIGSKLKYLEWHAELYSRALISARLTPKERSIIVRFIRAIHDEIRAAKG